MSLSLNTLPPEVHTNISFGFPGPLWQLFLCVHYVASSTLALYDEVLQDMSWAFSPSLLHTVLLHDLIYAHDFKLNTTWHWGLAQWYGARLPRP